MCAQSYVSDSAYTRVNRDHTRDDKVIEVLMKLLQLSEEERNKIIELCRKYPMPKIVNALRIVEMNVNKRLKRRKRYTIEEFEELVKKVRW